MITKSSYPDLRPGEGYHYINISLDDLQSGNNLQLVDHLLGEFVTFVAVQIKSRIDTSGGITSGSLSIVSQDDPNNTHPIACVQEIFGIQGGAFFGPQSPVKQTSTSITYDEGYLSQTRSDFPKALCSLIAKFQWTGDVPSTITAGEIIVHVWTKIMPAYPVL